MQLREPGKEGLTTVWEDGQSQTPWWEKPGWRGEARGYTERAWGELWHKPSPQGPGIRGWVPSVVVLRWWDL